MRDPLLEEVHVIAMRGLTFTVQVIVLAVVLWALVVNYVYPALDLHTQWAMWQHASLRPLAHINSLLVLGMCGVIALQTVTIEFLLLGRWWRHKAKLRERRRRGAQDLAGDWS